MMYYTIYNSIIGKIYLVSSGVYLIGAFFENQKCIKDYLNLQKKDDLEVFQKTKQWYDEYFSKKMPNPKTLPLKIEGSEFKKRVYEILLSIPYGETITYGGIAKQLSSTKKMSAQAVGNAVANNKLIIIIPCHRVVGKNNRLTGYSAGLDKKQWLLGFEKQQHNNLTRQKKPI